jgi:pentatricopeptide repeat protein
MEAHFKLIKNGKMLKKLSLFIGILLFVQSSAWAGLPQELKIEEMIEKYKKGNATVEDVLRVTTSNIIKLGANYSGALELLLKLKNQGISAGLMTYSSVMNSFAQARNSGKSDSTLHEMREHGISPDLMTYSNVIYA